MLPFLYFVAACVGHASNEIAEGETVEEILAHLSAQFCGCTHVYGNIRIRMSGLAPGVTLNESHFEIFYHLEQISGALLIDNIPETTRIVLPNLRIIRGEELLGGLYAVAVVNSSVGAIVMPKLTEISLGNVIVEDQPICNWALVNWPDILDNGRMTAPSFDMCVFDGNILFNCMP